MMFSSIKSNFCEMLDPLRWYPLLVSRAKSTQMILERNLTMPSSARSIVGCNFAIHCLKSTLTQHPHFPKCYKWWTYKLYYMGFKQITHCVHSFDNQQSNAKRQSRIRYHITIARRARVYGTWTYPRGSSMRSTNRVQRATFQSLNSTTLHSRLFNDARSLISGEVGIEDLTVGTWVWL